MAQTQIAAALLLAAVALPGWSQTTNAARIGEVARCGAEAMPFEVDAAHLHGDRRRQRATRITLSRRGWQSKAAPSGVARPVPTRRLFRATEHIHAADMPRLAALQAAAPGNIAIAYREVDGAELTYRTQD